MLIEWIDVPKLFVWADSLNLHKLHKVITNMFYR